MLSRRRFPIFALAFPIFAAVFPADLSARTPITREMRERLSRATVYIETSIALSSRDWSDLPEQSREMLGRRPATKASGSGFLVSPDGYVVTNAHVVEGFTELVYPNGATRRVPGTTRTSRFDPADPTKPFSLRFTAGAVRIVVHSGEDDERSFSARILRVKSGVDLALLKVPSGEDYEFLELGLGEEILPGSEVLMSGFPGGVLPDIAPFVNGSNGSALASRYPRASLNAGMVTAVREYEGSRRYQLDIRANHGNSGGPITNAQGLLVGVLYAGIDSMQSINYAIPVGYLGAILPSEVRQQYTEATSAASVEWTASEPQSFEDFMDSGSFEMSD